MANCVSFRFLLRSAGWLMVLSLGLGGARLRGLNPSRAVTQYIQSSWTIENGLPQNSVHAIAQTPDGFLWLGTEEGLTRFDGVEFTTFNHANTPGLPSDYIVALAVGRDGRLWVGTDSGLTAFQVAAGGLGAYRAYTQAEGLSATVVTTLWASPEGVLWVGTRKGLSRVVEDRAEAWPGVKPTEAITAIAGTSGTVWVGTRAGLYRIRGGQTTRVTKREGLPSEQISSLAAAGDGSLWVGMLAGGVAQIREGRATVPRVTLPVRDIESLFVDRDGGVWIGLDRHGLARLYEGRLSVYGSAQGLPSDRCTRAMFEDREGSLWIGLLDAGMVQLRDGKFAVFGKPEGLSGDYVGDVLEARDGSLWLGADSNGVNHLFADGRVEVWNRSRGLPNNAVFSLLEARDGSIWVGYRNGELAQIRGGSVRVYRDPQTVNVSLNALAEDAEGELWLGFWGKGLVRFAQGRFEHRGGNERVSQITVSHDGVLWVATDGDGLMRVEHGSVKRYDRTHGLPSDHVMYAFQDARKNVWVGTASGGLSLIRGDRVVSWGLKEGLFEGTVGSVVADGLGNVWFGGDAGIYREPEEELLRTAEAGGGRIHPVQYGTADGLRARETLYGGTPCVWKGRDGRLWFATIRGAAVVDPRHLGGNTVAPATHIEAFSFDGHPVPLRAGSRIGPGAGNIEASFTAASFVAPQKVVFRYRLVGFDPGWIAAGTRRKAWYTNLPAGKYTFVVEAQNSDGVWSEQGSSFPFVIVPPASRTPLAYGVYAVAGLLCVWGLLALRTRALVKRHRELERLVAERTEQLETEKSVLEAVRHELQVQATHDALTGMFNRAAIMDHLQREIARSVREKTALGVVVADLDHFKRVNDTYGHLCGDQVIMQCAERFRSVMRGYDLLGRLGGEEFLILLPGWDQATAPKRIEDLLRAISGKSFKTQEAELRMTCSLGVATFDPKGDDPAHLEVLRRADAALYAAKAAGRNCARGADARDEATR
ncbi:diguanylate cyclase [Acidobacteria bacterium AB60]|nr:diguanylate cyclase [Acidobacteria bacterium AB60]